MEAAPPCTRHGRALLRRTVAPLRAALICALVLASVASSARAEDRVRLGFAPARRGPDLHSEDAAQLAELRLRFSRERRREGLTLAVWGSMNVVGGSIAAGVKHEDRAWLSGSITSLSFGLINALLALPLLDLNGARRTAILREQTAPPMSVERLHAREAAAQLKSGQVFALNAGLDLLYLATGAFLLAMSQRNTQHADWERGVGAAFLIQAPFLLGFDIGCWIRANRRAAELSALR